MEKDHMLPGRRTVLRIAACTAAAAAPLFAPERPRTPLRPTAAPPAAGPEAAGAAGAGAGSDASAYRLRPMTAFEPAGLTRARPAVRQRPLLSLPALGHSVVLTFDDGPDRRYTPDILKILREHRARAMFFVCGEMAVRGGDLLRAMADEGHIVGNHSWSHPLVPRLAPSRIRDELGRTSEIIERSTGSAPRWYRAPYGAWNRLSFEIGAELGMEPLAWTVDTLDWREPGTGSIVARVMAGARPGAVVLSHDAGGDRSQSVAALRRYLPRLLEAGYGIGVPAR
ncbi:polysaccharide deacetylase family protein [Streptomyces sp. NPDC000410]|uniref:polysaccharide deacetylase family protein n=1 Tax=Streptomyces sp. NPDC000410 TaxID=3154254 RepID=UPI0033275303